jgi:ribonuclease E
MPKRMLIDAAHPEETRVVVTSGQRLEEFDFESSTKKQVKGNIYLAKVTRVEPSLQAAFVDYGGNRHGFLAFSEIHPDYYRIPISDRPAGEIDGPAENGRSPENGSDDAGVPLAAALPEPVKVPQVGTAEDDAAAEDETNGDSPPARDDGRYDSRSEMTETATPPTTTAAADGGWIYAPGMGPSSTAPAIAEPTRRHDAAAPAAAPVAAKVEGEWPSLPESPAENAGNVDELVAELDAIALRAAEESLLAAEIGESVAVPLYGNGAEPERAESESVETLGGDEVEEADAERRRTHSSRHYKIQEVIKRRQIMLVQVAKEERGNKGAALTTYLSLAGRYCVLMPNTNRGGGVSRKINSLSDRRRLKEILEELEIPEGMGVIVRTAGAERSKAEIKRDYEYLLRLWNEIRDLTLKSTAPALIYEEGNLIKRSIRDLYTRDIDEVLVEGEEGYKTAKAFMRTLMPSHAKRVQPYRDPQVPLFQRFQIESQIDAVHSPVAQLRSGGYVVINQTEALVAIDVNSGRSTRERNIEETALRTNLEAAEEIARQLRLRDLAGLIVIDFIDMEEHRNQGAVERRMKEALKNDRARIQVGRISPFGLMEMSRQRLRPSLAVASTQPCPHCGGTGFIRSVESTALYVLRSIEEEGIRRRSAEICLYVPTNVALYILNQKRESLTQIEARYSLKVMVARDDSLIPPAFRLERLRTYEAGEAPPLRAIQAPIVTEEDEEGEADETIEVAETAAEPASEAAAEDDRARRRRRRRRRRPDEAREGRSGAPAVGDDEADAAPASGEPAAKSPHDDTEHDREAEAERRRRRRGRRGGRVRPRREETAESAAAASSGGDVAAETIEVVAIGDEEPIRHEAEMIEAPMSWSADTGIEAASLAPLAGDASEPVPFHEQQDAGEPGPSYRKRGRGEAIAAHVDAEPDPTGEREEGIPYTSEAERVLEEAAAAPAARAMAEIPEAMQAESPSPAPQSRPDDNVLTVSEKPANPRRGWWQRLMQS